MPSCIVFQQITAALRVFSTGSNNATEGRQRCCARSSVDLLSFTTGFDFSLRRDGAECHAPEGHTRVTSEGTDASNRSASTVKPSTSLLG